MGGNNSMTCALRNGGGKVGFSKLSAFPIFFASLGWLVAVSLFCFIYMGLRSNTFCERGSYQAGILTSILNVSGTLASSVVPSLSMGMESEKQGTFVFDSAHADADHPSYCDFRESTDFLSEVHLLNCAARLARKRLQNSTTGSGSLAEGEVASSEERRIAFMFLTRGWNRHERLWKRFFEGHENLYSLYVHTNPKFRYQNSSIFYKHQVPSLSVRRFSINLVDAMRRLLAYAILDPEHGDSNWWFVFLCETSIPFRSFDFTYKYIMESERSFVESFLPTSEYLNWGTKPFFEQTRMRKGELWMAVHLRHASIILDDWNIYYLFKDKCTYWCTPDEQYIQTLLSLKDPLGIENRTIMYVDWAHTHAGSPFTYRENDLTVEWFKSIQNRTVDKDGEYHDTSSDAQLTGGNVSKICYHNEVPHSPCFLFARKIDGSAVAYINRLPPSILGY